MELSRDRVPLYLRNGSLYQNLDEDDNGTFEIPEQFYKENSAVDSDQDVIRVIQTSRFWGVEIPVTALQYIVVGSSALDLDIHTKEFPELETVLQKVSRVRATQASSKLVKTISEGLNLSLVQTLYHLGYPFSAEACEAAAAIGDFEILMYLHTEGCPWDERTTTAAAISNKIACLEYAVDFQCSVDANLQYVVAKSGNLAALQLVHRSGISLTSEVASCTLNGDHVDCLRYLHAQGCALPPTHTAATCGAFECLKFLHEQGVPWEEQTCLFAAKNGHLKCLNYANTHGAMWDADCCALAACGGHLNCLVYLRENGCPWNEKTLKCAVLTGSWACVRYAYANQCPMTATCMALSMWGLFVVVLLKVMLVPYVDPIHNKAQVAFFFIFAVRSIKKEYGIHELCFMGYNWTGAIVESVCLLTHITFCAFIVPSLSVLYNDWR